MPQNQPVFAGFRQQPEGNFAFTMVPNQFLDEIMPYEKPCVVKVLCLILRRTIGWVDREGQRRREQQVSYSEFAREMNMSTQAVADGLRIALAKGYITRVKPGGRNRVTGALEGAWYSLRWCPQENTGPNPSATSQRQGLGGKSRKPDASSLSGTPAADPPRVIAPVEHSLTGGQAGQHSVCQSEPDSTTRRPNPAAPAPKSRDMINKAESKIKAMEITEIEVNSSQNSPPPAPFSSYLGNLITDISQQFEDTTHRLPNIKQALNLWAATSLSEKEFAALVYLARDRTRSFAAAPLPFRRQKTTSTRATSRMAYFFRVLANLLKAGSSSAGAGKPTPGRTKVAAPVVRREDTEPPRLPAPLSAGTETPAMWRKNLAATSSDPSGTLRHWSCFQAGLSEPALISLSSNLLIIEPDRANPLFEQPVGATLKQPTGMGKTFLLVCRSTFEARIARHKLAGLEEVARLVYGPECCLEVVDHSRQPYSLPLGATG